jgi:hypothetical protein
MVVTFELKTKQVGVKTAPTVFIKKKKLSPDLENPRTPISPVNGFFLKSTP